MGDRDSFRIVGIGASAGGLEALEEFFRSIPDDSQLAFVVIQHLSPDYKSLMVELLSKYTSMEVKRAEDGMEVGVNNVYLIPPRKNLKIYHGKLYLSEQDHSHGLNLPIDIFLRSLADDQKELSIGIILSGTGSDGTLGIRAVKGAGGLVFAQDNISAKFDGMPRSASSTGLVDYVLPPKEIAHELTRIIQHPLLHRESEEREEERAQEHSTVISKILSRIHDVVGVDFSAYKDTTVIRRIERRIGITQLETTEEYAAYLDSSPKEVHVLYKDLLIGVTRFFRDTEAFDSLKETAVLDLLKNHENDTQLRLWCMGCSTGEEAYSMAILFYEKMEELGIDYDVKIFATDIDRESIEYAGLGIYPESIVTDVNQGRLHRFFTKKENTFQVNPEIRRMVVFANHNVLQDPPFSAIDMISCRNMLIYLKPDMQQRVLGAFHFSVKQNGYLFLGSSETVGELSGVFSLIDTKWKIYQCKQKSTQKRVADYFVPPVQPNSKKRERFPQKVYGQKSKSGDVLESAYDYLVHEYVPPSIIIDRNLTLIHVCREASDYMKIPTGKISLNVLEMLPNGIKAALSTAVHKSLKEDSPVTYRDLSVKNNGETRYIDLSVKPVLDRQSNPVGYFLVMFEDHEGTVHKAEAEEKGSFDEQQNKMIADLEQELQFTKENLQATIEELETSNEELQATNEELIASNEELQSTNEELQSVNEELYTVNAEYQNKIDELSEANNDLKNFLNNTDIGMVFLDKDFKIRKYTPAATEVINIMEMDVGRPIEHITRNMQGTGFMEDVRKVLINLVSVEKEISTKNGKWFLMKILPYRTVNNVVEGIVITFLDIDEKKSFEEKLEKERDLLMRILESSPVGKTMVNRDGNIVYANQKAAEIFGISREDILKRSFADRGWEITDYDGNNIAIEQLPFSKILQNGESLYDFKHAIKKPDGNVIYLVISGAPLFSEESGEVDGAVFSIQENR